MTESIVFVCQAARSLSPALVRSFEEYLNMTGKSRHFEVRAVGILDPDIKSRINKADIVIGAASMHEWVERQLESEGFRPRMLLFAQIFLMPGASYPAITKNEPSPEKLREWGDGILKKIEIGKMAEKNALMCMRRIKARRRTRIIAKKRK